MIRGLLDPGKYVVAVEHDLAVLDYLSDFICCLYGKPGAYGVVTMPFSVREVTGLASTLTETLLQLHLMLDWTPTHTASAFRQVLQ